MMMQINKPTPTPAHTCLTSFLYTKRSRSGPMDCLMKASNTETMMTVSRHSRKQMKKTGIAKTFVMAETVVAVRVVGAVSRRKGNLIKVIRCRFWGCSESTTRLHTCSELRRSRCRMQDSRMDSGSVLGNGLIRSGCALGGMRSSLPTEGALCVDDRVNGKYATIPSIISHFRKNYFRITVLPLVRTLHNWLSHTLNSVTRSSYFQNREGQSHCCTISSVLSDPPALSKSQIFVVCVSASIG